MPGAILWATFLLFRSALLGAFFPAGVLLSIGASSPLQVKSTVAGTLSAAVPTILVVRIRPRPPWVPTDHALRRERTVMEALHRLDEDGDSNAFLTKMSKPRKASRSTLTRTQMLLKRRVAVLQRLLQRRHPLRFRWRRSTSFHARVY